MEVDPEKGEPSEGPYETGFDIRPDSNYGIWKELEEGLVEVTLEGTGDLKSFEAIRRVMSSSFAIIREVIRPPM